MVKKCCVNTIVGDAAAVIPALPDESIQTIVTSPPYWGVRDYGHIKQIGREHTIDHYIASLIAVFSELLPKTKKDGTLWLNIGDVYTSGNRKWRASDSKNPKRYLDSRPRNPEGLKHKELIGLPWRLAFALQKTGWHLRSEIIWTKSNAMPESVKDRPSRTHEKIFLFSKNTHYYYNTEKSVEANRSNDGVRKLRDVWVVNTEKSLHGHPAPFPQELAAKCLELTSKPGDLILDPFAGSGTTGVVAAALKRNSVLVDIDRSCMSIIRKRLKESDVLITAHRSSVNLKLSLD